jgi:DNA mismatch repair protein MutS2
MKTVPLDLELGEKSRLLLVSGPNMGGKTVLLKTVGLAVALTHAGLPVLASEGSAVPVFADLRADLGDEQSVDRGLSTFAAHLLALKAMAEAAAPDVLLLADELGAGTDPEEGAALGRVLVEHAAEKRAWGVLTTHLGSLKRVASEVPGVVNGSLEFDLETLTSRYRFRRGVPGASHALDVAGRLGFPQALIERARALTSGCWPRSATRSRRPSGNAISSPSRARPQTRPRRSTARRRKRSGSRSPTCAAGSPPRAKRCSLVRASCGRRSNAWRRRATRRVRMPRRSVPRSTASSAVNRRSRPRPHRGRSGSPSRRRNPRRRYRSSPVRGCGSPTSASTRWW